MKFIRNFSKFKLIKESFNDTKTFFEKNQDIILSYYKFIFDNCGNANAIEEFESKWAQLLEHIKKNFNSSFTEFKNWITYESKTRLKLSLNQNIDNWQKQNKDSLNVISEFETMLGFSLGDNNLQRVDTRTDKNCFDNKTLTTVQPLPHNFRRNGKDVICKDSVNIDESKPSILLIPGGDGKPAVDFEHISKDLTEYNLFSMNYDQDQFESIDTWSAKMAQSALDVIPGNFSIVSFSLGGSIGFFAIKSKFDGDANFTKKIVFIDAGIPEEGTGNDDEDFINHVNKFCGEQNPPQKYNCMRKSKIEESKTKALSSKDVLEFRYKFETPFDMVANDGLELGSKRNEALFEKLKFDEEIYEDWKKNLHNNPSEQKKDTMIFEYLDDPKGTDRSHTLVENKPSAVYLNGELIDLKLAKEKQTELEITDAQIWVVRDKAEAFEGETKQFWWEDPWQKNIFEWTKKHIKNTGKKIGKGEKLPPGVKALYIGAGGTEAKPMSEKDKKEIESRSPTDEGNTRFEYIENCTHASMLEVVGPSKKIAELIKEFLTQK